VPALRNIQIALFLSLLIHALIFSIPLRQRVGLQSLGSSLPAPLTVLLLPAQPAPADPAPPAEPVREASPAPASPPVAAARPLPPPPPPRAIDPRLPPRPAPEPRAAPQFDMMAAINARRERRRAADAAAARPSDADRQPSAEDVARATIERNLRTSPTEGVGGVFTILRKGTRTAEFAFNGWRPESYRQWREVIEVDAGPGGDVERAIVRRMIELIRSHYAGDFRWESHRLGRVVILSARPEDNEGLEDFLIREFFGTPTLGPAG
jgi:hypothetical protein